VAVFLTTIGAPTYALLCNLAAPNNPATKTYAKLIRLAGPPKAKAQRDSNFTVGVQQRAKKLLNT